MKKDEVPALAFSADVEAPEGLDPKVYSVSVLVDRHDGKPLTEAELAKLRAIYGGRSAKRSA